MTHYAQCSSEPCLCEVWQYGTVFLVACLVVLCEGVAWHYSRSVAVGGDVSHTAVDSLGLLIPMSTALLVYARGGIESRMLRFWGALGQSLLLAGIGVMVMHEAWERFLHPTIVFPEVMLMGGCIGLFGNIMMLRVARNLKDAHVTGSLLHMHVVADLLLSIVVIVGGMGVLITGSTVIEALAGLAIGAYLVGVIARSAARETYEAYVTHA